MRFEPARSAAEKEIEKFHDAYNGGAFAEIYRTAAAELRAGTPESAFIDTITKVRDELGRCVAVRLKRWGARRVPSGTIVMIESDSYFERGQVVEVFNFLVTGGVAKLVNYTIPPARRGAGAA